MAALHPDYRISPTAWRAWERCTMPVPLPEMIEAVFGGAALMVAEYGISDRSSAEVLVAQYEGYTVQIWGRVGPDRRWIVILSVEASPLE